MILTALVSERGEPTGLSLACSSSAIAEALHSQFFMDDVIVSAEDHTSMRRQAITSKLSLVSILNSSH